jgi:hypothetical protein
MSSWFGAKATATEPVVPETTLRIQSSVQGQPIALGWGQARLAGNLIWYGDFTYVAQQNASSGGKGGGSGGGSPTGYNYSAAVAIGICEGPVSNIGQVYNDRSVSALSALSLNAFLGSYTQSPWGYLTTAHPDSPSLPSVLSSWVAGGFSNFNATPSNAPVSAALAFRGLAYVAAGPMQLGSSPTLPNLSYEVTFGINTAISGVPDANPKDIVVDFLTNAHYGVGFPASRIDTMTQFSNFCFALGVMVSPVLTSQVAANSFLGDLLTTTNSEAFFSGGVLKIQPYWDFSASGNGRTFAPNTTPVYDFGPDDFLPQSGDAITITRRAASSVYNSVALEYLNRSNNYNPTVITAKNDASIQAFGLQARDTLTLHMLCYGPAALTAVQMQLGRENLMNTYVFTVPSKYILVDPMDVVTLTSYLPAHGLALHPVRVKEISENADGSLTMTAVDLLVGANSPAAISTDSNRGAVPDHNEAPGNVATPVFFEPPFSLTGALEVWGGVYSANPNWGGCEIWVSADNTSYQYVGKQFGAARMGTLTAALPAPPAAPPAMDTTNTLAIDVSASNATIASASDIAATALGTISWVDGEVIAYAFSTPTSTGHYNLTHLVRGAYNTIANIVSHPIGSNFVRLDDGVFKIPYGQIGINSLFYVKFLSFNRYGGALQSLSDVSPYTFTPVGTAYFGSLAALADLSAEIRYQVTNVEDSQRKQLLAVEQNIAALTSTLASQQWVQTQTVATRISQQSDRAFAEISNVQTVSSAADAAMATSITSLTATVAGNTATIVSNTTAIATLNSALASQVTTLTAAIAGNTSSITINSTAIASNTSGIGALNGYAATAYGVALDVNGYNTGFQLINGGGGISSTTFTTATFQIAAPGVSGGAPVPVWTVASVGGANKAALRGDMLVDGSVTTQVLNAGAVTAGKIATGTITSASGVIGALGVDSLSIKDNAITVPTVATIGSLLGTGSANLVFNFNLSVDTTGLSGKTIAIYVICNMTYSAPSTTSTASTLQINSTTVANLTFIGSTNGNTYVISGSLNVTGTGSVMTIPVQLFWNAPNTCSLSTSNCFAVAAKR